MSEVRSGSDTGTLIGAAVHDADGHMTKLCEVSAGGTVSKTATDCTASGTGATTLALVWNALDHLATATRTGANAIAESYQYDDSGRRISKTSDATTTSYLYDGDEIHAEWNGSISGNPAAAYVHGANIDEPLLRLTGATNSPAATQAAYLQDGLGSVVGTTNITGTLTANQRFDAWGNKTASSGTIPQYGYTGREPDATGMTFYRARYYHTGIARFASRDPMGMADAVSGYAYVKNNPVNLVDPLGLYAMPSSSFGSGGGSGGSGKGPTLPGGNFAFLDFGAPTQQGLNAFALGIPDYSANPFATNYGQGTQVAAGPLLPLIGIGLIANEIATGDVPMIGGGAVKATERAAGQLHHIATDKAIKSGYTDEFTKIFDKAGMKLNDPANKVFLEGHAGRHSSAYHEHILKRLDTATDGLSGSSYEKALRSELDALRTELLKNPDMVKGIGIKP